MYACIHVRGMTDEQRIKLQECASAFSPNLEYGGDYVTLDVRGLGSLIGTANDIASTIARHVSASGLNANVAIASNPHAAAVAARGRNGKTIILPGQEAAILGPLPLDLLSPEEEMAETLAAWGIRTFRDLAALPETGIAERLGTAAVRLQQLARGLSTTPIVPTDTPLRFESAMDLDHGVDQLEPLSFVLSRLLNDVCGGLAREGLSAHEMELRLMLEDKSEFIRTLQLPFPTRDAATFLKLLQYDLNAHPPQAAILRAYLRAQPVPPRVLQGGLFIPPAPEAEKLELTLARLTAIAGEGNVGSPEILNTHRPGAFRMRRFQIISDEPKAAPPVPCLAIRVFRPPLPAQVVLSGSGMPQKITARGIRGSISSCSGPWRTSGDWWRPDIWARDEWDIALNSGTLYRLIHEPGDRWFIDGNYD